jgi:hypothetical protein
LLCAVYLFPRSLKEKKTLERNKTTMIFPTPSWLPTSPLARSIPVPPEDSKPSAVPNRPPVAFTPIQTATVVSNLVATSAPRKVVRNPYAKVFNPVKTRIVVASAVVAYPATTAVVVCHEDVDASKQKQQQQNNKPSVRPKTNKPLLLPTNEDTVWHIPGVLPLERAVPLVQQPNPTSTKPNLTVAFLTKL